MVVLGNRPLRCAITDLAGSGLHSPHARHTRLATQIDQWSAQRIDFVQLREKHLHAGELLSLAELAMQRLRQAGAAGTRLLVNARPDVAAAAGADGVHLTAAAGELTPAQVRHVFRAAGRATCLVGVSCHCVEEVARARDGGADLLLFGPVFEKRIGGELAVAGSGLERLRAASAAARGIPVLALGGVTPETITPCLNAGASGVAGIRLFS